MKATTDTTVTNAVPANLFSDLSINITGIASTNVPAPYVYYLNCLIWFNLFLNISFFKLQSLADAALASTCISSVTSLYTISTYLPGITADSLSCITDSLMIATVVSIIYFVWKYLNLNSNKLK